MVKNPGDIFVNLFLCHAYLNQYSVCQLYVYYIMSKSQSNFRHPVEE